MSLGRYATAAFLFIVGVTWLEARQAGAFEITNPPLRRLSKCLTDAIERGNVTQRAHFVEFWCEGDLAREFYDYIGGDKTAVEFTDNNRGYSRKIGDNSECFNITESATGKALTRFSCHLRISAENILNR
jgi:hypothetical protein